MESNSIAPIPGSDSQSVRNIVRNGGGVPIPNYVIEMVGTEPGTEEIELREYVRRVLRNKSIVVIITLLLLLIPAYYIFTTPIFYRSEAKIQVDSENQTNLNQTKGSPSTHENRAYFNTQLKLLENPKLIRNVINDNGLDTNEQFLDEKFADLPSFKPEQIARRKPRPAGQTGRLKAANEVAEAERLKPLVEAIQKSLTVQPILQSKQAVKDTRLISIKFKHPDPAISKLVANSLADELVDQNLNDQTDANSSEREYLKTNIGDLLAQIRRGETKILQYGRQHQLPSEGGDQNTVVERLVGLNRQLLEAENDRKFAEAKYKASLAPGASEALANTGAKDIADIDAKLDDLRRKRAQLLVEVTEKHPEALAIDKQIAILENAAKNKRTQATSNYKTGLSVSYKQNVAREKSIRKSYNQQWEKVLNQNGAAINYRIIQQELETNRKLLDEMQRREKESEMLTAKAPNNIRVIEYALTPTEPIDRRRLAYFGLAFLASFSFGIAGALLRDHFNDSAHSAVEITEPLSLQAMASVPEMGGNVLEKSQQLSYSSPSSLMTDSEPLPFENGDELTRNPERLSVLEEALQDSRTVLQLSPDVHETKTLLITSSRKIKGQTTTLVNIAKNLARTGASVLIIDSDFRDPKIHKAFESSNERGFSNLLTEQFYKKNIRDLIIGASEDLYFLPSGPIPYNCSKCLGSDRMGEVMASLAATFDYIIIDSPPVLFFADSSVIAKNADGVLLVVEESSNSLQELEQIRMFLKPVGAKIVGVVLEPSDR